MTDKEFVLSRYPKVTCCRVMYSTTWPLSEYLTTYDIYVGLQLISENSAQKAWANAAEAIRKMEEEDER